MDGMHYYGRGDNLIYLKASRLVNLPEFRIYVMVSVIINPLETGLTHYFHILKFDTSVHLETRSHLN